MKRPSFLFLLAVCLVVISAAGWFVSFGRPHALVSTGELAKVSPESSRSPLLGSGGTAAPASAEVGDASAPLLFPQPASSTGKRLERKDPAYLKVSMEGGSPIGRVAKLDLATLPALASLRKGDRVTLPLLDGKKAEVSVNVVLNERGAVRVGGGFTDGSGGFSLTTKDGRLSGLIQLRREGRALVIVPEADGSTQMVEKLLRDVVCSPIPRFDDNGPIAAKAERAVVVPILNSRPSAVCQVYLDFDGETVTDPDWDNGNTIIAPPYNLSSATITNIFNRVKEDYYPFNINITTDVNKYNNAAVGKRMRCIITSNDAAANGAGGVAYLDSFRRAGVSFSDDIPCWVFNSQEIGIAEAISHEVGHTFNLNHDGRVGVPRIGDEEYYQGHGSGATSWCPIMGAGYSVTVTQWSKGEYQYASNKEDDLQFISSRVAAATGGGSTGYVTDDAGNTFTSAVSLSADTTDGTVTQNGNIEKTADVDYYSFTTNGGNATVTADGSVRGQNLDIVLEIVAADGSVVTNNSPVTSLDASVSATLAAGNYFIKVTSSGALDPFLNGYSNYASLGEYRLTGTIVGLTKAPLITSATTASGKVGILFTYQITASGNPTTFGVTGALPPGVTVDPATGLISGTPTAIGNYTVQLTASNSAGSGSRQLIISIAPPDLTLGEAVDFESLTWTSGGSAPWVAETVTTSDGTDAAQSGAVGDNGQSYFETTVTGPVVVKFAWKVSSQQDADFLAFQVDGTDAGDVTPISGEVGFIDAQSSIPAGTHTLRWVYRHDGSLVDGTDAAWVDNVRFLSTVGPSITSAGSANAVVGNFFSYTIQATHLPGSFAVGGILPAGVKLDPRSGVLSGVPAVAGTYNLTITATNNIASDTKNFTLTIAASPITVGEALDLTTATWTLGGDANWFPETVETSDGVDALQAGPIGNNQQTFVRTTAPANQTVVFQWKVDSDVGDTLQFLVDGSVKATISGSTQWQTFSYFNSTSAEVRWVYTKNASGANGRDTGWLDQVVFTTQSKPDITSATTASGLSNTPFVYQITATNSPAKFNASDLPAGLSIDTTTGLISGNPQAAGTYNATIFAGNLAGLDSQALTITILPSLADAVDQPGRVFATGGAADWIPQSDVTFDTVDAAASGIIGGSSQSFFETTVTGPIDVKFRWKVSSEANHDFLRFLVDDALKGSISGEVDWNQRTFTIPAGSHKVTWSYQKDPSSQAGQDRGWVDNVVFDAGANLPSIVSPLEVTAFVGRAFTYQISATNSPTSFNATGVPAPFVFNGSVISGTPTVPAEALVNLSATNSAGTGTAVLKLHVISELPGADAKANATGLGGALVRSVGSNVFATAEVNEPTHAGRPATASIWWTWTAPATGTAIVSTAGSGIDTVLSVYRSFTDKNGLAANATYENDDARGVSTSLVRFPVNAGDTCLIAVDGVGGATGQVVLNIGYAGAGVYTGLVTDENATAEPGLLTLKLTEKLSFTGQVRLNGQKYSLRGAFVEGEFTGAASAGRNSVPLPVQLSLNLADGAEEVTGTITSGGVTYDILSKLALSKTDVPADLPTTFTFLIEPNTDLNGAPQGIGFGTASIDKKGKFKASGTLGDGTKFSFAQQLALDRTAAFFVTPYKKGGLVAGPLAIDSGNAFAPLSCVLDWHKVANLSSKTYALGIDTTVNLRGYRHNSALPALTPGSVTASFTAADLGLQPADLTFTIATNSSTTTTGGLKISFSTKTGLFSGSFPSTGGAARKFGGAVVKGTEFIQDSAGNVTEHPINRGAGHFIGLHETGAIHLTPTPAP